MISLIDGVLASFLSSAATAREMAATPTDIASNFRSMDDSSV